MKKLIAICIVLLSFSSQADQLAYITKAQAEEAAQYITDHSTIFLFCGCCAMEKPRKVTVLEAKANHTGYEDYYEVEIKCQDEDGKVFYEKLDFAYVWVKKMFKYKTVGAILDMEHDSCVYLKKWDDPKNAEMDI